jgi:hypothetical protein
MVAEMDLVGIGIWWGSGEKWRRKWRWGTAGETRVELDLESIQPARGTVAGRWWVGPQAVCCRVGRVINALVSTGLWAVVLVVGVQTWLSLMG